MSRSDPTTPLTGITFEAATARNLTQRRLWAARDNVTRLRIQLADAEAVLSAAEHDDDEALAFLTDTWKMLRDELSKPAPCAVPNPESSSQ